MRFAFWRKRKGEHKELHERAVARLSGYERPEGVNESEGDPTARQTPVDVFEFPDESSRLLLRTTLEKLAITALDDEFVAVVTEGAEYGFVRRSAWEQTPSASEGQPGGPAG